jgi:hypothetical protein
MSMKNISYILFSTLMVYYISDLFNKGYILHSRHACHATQGSNSVCLDDPPKLLLLSFLNDVKISYDK